ncbi:hypothetical protein C0991_007189 [Blastosporella zonata]|nr:hypothetical protein C0991_007189 [Blastosporella zonata]
MPVGQDIPLLGLGVYQNDDCAPAVEAALKAGYIHIDTAQIYQNEDQVGAAVKASGVPRESIFITSKVADGGDKTTASVQSSLKKLDLSLNYHPPSGSQANFIVKVTSICTSSTVDTEERPGVKHLEEIREAGLPTPAVNQIELHPFCQQKPIVEYCRAHGILVQAYCPLIRGDFSNPVIQEVAQETKKTPAQVLSRWSIQRGFLPLPKSSDPARVFSNADIYDFELSDAALTKLDALDRGDKGSISWNPVDVD